ncbi:RDD family protein [Massilia sp. B-10]|nr:RDD family protein [Massilia sp. B-10]
MLDGRLSLTTPEGIRLLLTPAGPFLRASAWAIDFAIWLGIMLLTRMILPNGKLGDGIAMVIMFLTYWGYPIICEVYFGGRTIGKRATGLMVVRDNGLPVGWRESTLRNLLLVADFLPMVYVTGLVSMMLDRRFRRVGDIVSQARSWSTATSLAAPPLARAPGRTDRAALPPQCRPAAHADRFVRTRNPAA